MNPWKQTILILLHDILRFVLHLGVVALGLMTAIFSIVFVYQFLRHLWSWCDRVMFTGSW